MPELGSYLGNVSEACRTPGYYRDTCYRVKKLYDEGGVEAVKEVSRRKPNPRNRVPEEMERAFVEYAVEQPVHGQVGVTAAMAKRGITIWPACVRCVWLRHDLESMKKQLRALEMKAAEEGYVLTEAQIQAL